MSRIRIAFLIFISFFSIRSFSQQRLNTDSLKRVIARRAHDTATVTACLQLVNVLKMKSPDSAFALVQNAVKLVDESSEMDPVLRNYSYSRLYCQLGEFCARKRKCEEAEKNYHSSLMHCRDAIRAQTKNQLDLNKVQRLITAVYGGMAINNFYRADYPAALHYYAAAVQMAGKAGNKMMMATNTGNMGNVYMMQGNYPKAMECYFQQLSIVETLKDPLRISGSLSNLGLVYQKQGDTKRALEYFSKAIKLDEEMENYRAIIVNLVNMGAVHTMEKDYGQAMINYNRALEVNEFLGDSLNLGTIIGNIAMTYAHLGKHQEALDQFRNSLAIFQVLNHKEGVAVRLQNVGAELMNTGKYAEARRMTLESIQISASMGWKEGCRDGYFYLARVDSASGNYKAAFDDYGLYVAYRDTLLNDENTKKQTQLEMQFEFDKKEAQTKMEQDRKDAAVAEETRKRSIIFWCVAAGLAVVLLFAVFIYRAYRQKQKSTIEISLQKHIIEEKQKEILDSIHYAKRIQTALLTSESYIARKIRYLKKN